MTKHVVVIPQHGDWISVSVRVGKDVVVIYKNEAAKSRD